MNGLSEIFAGPLLVVLALIGWATGWVSLLLVVTGAGYYSYRVLAGLTGFRRASSEQFRKDIAFAAMCVLFLILLALVFEWVWNFRLPSGAD